MSGFEFLLIVVVGAGAYYAGYLAGRASVLNAGPLPDEERSPLPGPRSGPLAESSSPPPRPRGPPPPASAGDRDGPTISQSAPASRRPPPPAAAGLLGPGEEGESSPDKSAKSRH
jgi:hypothetical protein